MSLQHRQVAAQSTLGEDIFARKYVKNLENARILHGNCPTNYREGARAPHCPHLLYANGLQYSPNSPVSLGSLPFRL